MLQAVFDWAAIVFLGVFAGLLVRMAITYHPEDDQDA